MVAFLCFAKPKTDRLNFLLINGFTHIRNIFERTCKEVKNKMWEERPKFEKEAMYVMNTLVTQPLTLARSRGIYTWLAR